MQKREMDEWMQAYAARMLACFGARVRLIGLQGSYARGEATPESDIDAVLILDVCTPQDLLTYDCQTAALSQREKLCGFVGGEATLLCWDRADLVHFCLDTRPVYGSLDKLWEKIDADDARRAVLRGACDVYHLCAHNMLHEKSPQILTSLYKSMRFSLRAAEWAREQTCGKALADAMAEVCGGSLAQCAAKNARQLRSMPEMAQTHFDALSEQLFLWAQETIELCGGAA